MKDRKSSLLLISSVCLLLISVGLLSAWAYFYFQKKKGPVQKESRLPAKETAINQITRDSLQSDFTAAITNMDTSLKTFQQVDDTAKGNVNGQIRELYDLRKEIPALLNTTNKEDLDSARIKIITLQLKIDELRSRTQRVESENKRLNALLEQLSKQLKNEQKSVVRTSPELSRSIDRSATSSPFSAGDFRLWAEGENDKETSQPEQAEKVNGSFTVRSSQNPSSAIEMMVVIIRPDGRVLKGSEWESGTFETADGRKVYSAKVVFDYNKGESRKVSFSISGEDFLRGNYTLQVYHNGNLVGQGYRNLF